MTRAIPFTQRFGAVLPATLLDREVSQATRIALVNILADIVECGYVRSWDVLAGAVLYAGRRLREDYSHLGSEAICTTILLEMEWFQVYIFCERVFRLLKAPGYWNEGEYVETASLDDARQHFSDSINTLMDEDGLAYEFDGGVFHRRGRPQTRRSLERVGAVLSDPRYRLVRKHYNKATGFFNEKPVADVENCIKEVVCALEAFVDLEIGKVTGKDFEKVIRSKYGASRNQIPPTIGESIIKLRAFRGDAKGVAHAALSGAEVDTPEAELALSLGATFITYLHDKSAAMDQDVPF